MKKSVIILIMTLMPLLLSAAKSALPDNLDTLYKNGLDLQKVALTKETLKSHLAKEERLYLVYQDKAHITPMLANDAHATLYAPLSMQRVTEKLLPFVQEQNLTYTWLDRYSVESSWQQEFKELLKPKYIFYALFTILSIGSLFYVDKIRQYTSSKNKTTLYKPNEIKGSFEDIVGQEEIKKELFTIIDMIRNGSHYKKYGLDQPSNLIFSGPPGTGKTKMASYFAKELGFPLLYASAATLETGYVGGGANVVKGIHAKANKLKKVVIFFDEAQTLLAKRGQSETKWADDTINAFLSALDGVSAHEDTQIIWILASNFDNSNFEIDSALLRRFQKQINFRLPTKEERLALFRHFIHQAEPDKIGDVDYEDLATISHRLSPAAIGNIVKEAAANAASENTKIDTSMLIDAFERGVVGLSTAKKHSPKNRDSLYVATHELGHFFAHYHSVFKEILNQNNIALSEFVKLPAHQRQRLRIEARERCDILKISIQGVQKIEGGSLGYALFKPDEEELPTLVEFKNQIVDLYGGLAAEAVVFGEAFISLGAMNDLERVEKLTQKLYHAGFAQIDLLEKSRKAFLKERYKESVEAILYHKEELLSCRVRLIERGKLTLDEIIPDSTLKSIIDDENALEEQHYRV